MFYGRLKTTKDGKERLRDPECIKNAILKEDEK